MYLDSVYPKLYISNIGIHDDQSIFASCWQSSLVLLVIQPLLLLLLLLLLTLVIVALTLPL